MNDRSVNPGTGAEVPRSARQDVLDPALLGELRNINERGVRLLQERARAAPAREPARYAADLDAWLALDPAAVQRLAAQPFLLFGIGLEDAARWQRPGADAVGEVRPAAAAPAFTGTARDAAAGCWPADGAAYARVLTHYAWHLARTAPRTATLVAGMSPQTATALRDCPVGRLDALAQRSVAWLQLRWHDQPRIWAHLLDAARADSTPEAARSATLRALQRLGAAWEAAGAHQAGPSLW